jgi:hypothetical protein
MSDEGLAGSKEGAVKESAGWDAQRAGGGGAELMKAEASAS